MGSEQWGRGVRSEGWWGVSLVSSGGGGEECG